MINLKAIEKWLGWEIKLKKKKNDGQVNLSMLGFRAFKVVLQKKKEKELRALSLLGPFIRFIIYNIIKWSFAIYTYSTIFFCPLLDWTQGRRTPGLRLGPAMYMNDEHCWSIPRPLDASDRWYPS